MTDRTLTWSQDEVRPLPLERIDERLHRYRLAQPKVEKRMAQSLERYGQVSPVVICLQEDEYVLIDGFKRLTAARRLKGMTRLQARRMDVDEQGAKGYTGGYTILRERIKQLRSRPTKPLVVRFETAPGAHYDKRCAMFSSSAGTEPPCFGSVCALHNFTKTPAIRAGPARSSGSGG